MQLPSQLSPSTLELIHKLFTPEQREQIRALLAHECNREKLSCTGWTDIQMERIWFAVLKMTREDSLALMDAALLAQADWRDLLEQAGFASDLEAHEKWRAAQRNADGRTADGP